MISTFAELLIELQEELGDTNVLILDTHASGLIGNLHCLVPRLLRHPFGPL